MKHSASFFTSFAALVWLSFHATAQVAAPPNATPPAVAFTAKHPAAKALVAELDKLSPRAWLLHENPDVALERFGFVTVKGVAKQEKVAVEGQAFATAWRIQTEKKGEAWHTMMQSLQAQPVAKGDVLYVTLWVRAVELPAGAEHGVAQFFVNHKRGAQNEYLASPKLHIPKTWTRIHIPATAVKEWVEGDKIQYQCVFGALPQTIEIGGIQAVNLGPGVDLAALPHAEMNLSYEGQESDAPWRKEALARIEKIRKGDLKITVLDAAGKPVRGAKVNVAMKRHAFHFGSSFRIGMLGKEYQQLGGFGDPNTIRTAKATPAEKERFQKEFLRLFNCAELHVPWRMWVENQKGYYAQSDVLGALRWFAEKDIPVFHIQAIYPSLEFAPKIAKEWHKAKQRAEFERALKEYVQLTATKFAPPVRSIQLANEIEFRPDFTDLLGRESVVDWFRWVKEANPQMETEINGVYLLGEAEVQTENRGDAWPTNYGIQYYYDLIAWLLKRGAPIDAIGFQQHGSIGAPGPPKILKCLDTFGKFGKALEVTEFEITLQSGADSRQRQFQADFLRDFYIAIFSHPQTDKLILQDFWQPAAWQEKAASAFFNEDWSLNPHGKAYEDLVLRDWWTREQGATADDGTFAVRGFLGDYEIEVESGGAKKTVLAKLVREGVKLSVQVKP